MGLFGGGNKKTSTTVNSTSSSQTRDIGFTGAAGVDLATNLAVVGQQTSADQLVATSEVTRGLTETVGDTLESLTKGAFASNERQSLIASNSLNSVIQNQSAGFNQLVGGANDLVKTAGDLIDDTAIIAKGQVATGENTFAALLEAANDTFDKVVGAARGVASDLTAGSTAFVEGATATVERLGPQTKQNQNIAFAGMAVAAVVVAAFVLKKG